MGGAVKSAAAAVSKTVNNVGAVSNVVEKPLEKIPIIQEIPKTAKTMRKTTTNFFDTIKDGGSLFQATGSALRPSVQQVGGNIKEVGVGSGLMKDNQPQVEAPIDAEAVNEANKKEKARAKRQAEIDILTDRPGRGGTILTDQYQYKV